MNFKILNRTDPRVYAVIMDEGDKVEECLLDFARMEGINAAQLSAIGAFSWVRVGYFDLDLKDYIPVEINEQVEVLNLTGDVALYKDAPVLHAHVVVGKRDGTAHGGHLLAAVVRPTLEIILTESPAYLTRRMNKEFGIPLIHVQ